MTETNSHTDGASDTEVIQTNSSCHEKPQSFVIFDTETTGLPGPYGNPRITEFCLLGVHREDLFEDGVKMPRVVNKLQLALNPEKRVTPGASMLTGLFNDVLERQSPFNSNTVRIVEGFIQAHAQPVCLLAHNGDKFDFPLLLAELKRVGEKLPDNLLCADSLIALRELDAIPECCMTNSGVKRSWERTEVTPVKRPSCEENQDGCNLPKKKKDSAMNGAHFENTDREKVSKRLFSDHNSDQVDTVSMVPGQKMTSTDNAIGSGIQMDKEDFILMETKHERTPSERSPAAEVQVDVIQESLEDADILLAVSEIESKEINQNGLETSIILTDTSTQNKDTNSSRNVVNDCNVADSSHLSAVSTSSSAPVSEAIPIADEHVGQRVHDVSVDSQDQMENQSMNLSSSFPDEDFLTAVEQVEELQGTNITPVAHCSKDFQDGGPVAHCSKDFQDGGPVAHCSKDFQDGGPVAHCSKDFQAGGPSKVKDSVEAKEDNSGMMNTNKNSNSCESNTKTSDVQKTTPLIKQGSSGVRAHQGYRSNGTARRSFRLSDVYERHFGHPPAVAHTAEDDCVSLLKIVKKFSPRILEWFDEHCVPFSSLTPMY